MTVPQGLLLLFFILIICVQGLFLLALRLYRDEFVARKIVWIPLARIVEILVLIVGVGLHIAGFLTLSELFLVGASARIVPVIVSSYLTGVLFRWWNGGIFKNRQKER